MGSWSSQPPPQPEISQLPWPPSCQTEGKRSRGGWKDTRSYSATVKDHDFPDESVPRAYPYGVYDLAHSKGWVNIGTDRDTAAFAVASIRGW